jgi:hypothetical protein
MKFNILFAAFLGSIATRTGAILVAYKSAWGDGTIDKLVHDGDEAEIQLASDLIQHDAVKESFSKGVEINQKEDVLESLHEGIRVSDDVLNELIKKAGLKTS